MLRLIWLAQQIPRAHPNNFLGSATVLPLRERTTIAAVGGRGYVTTSSASSFNKATANVCGQKILWRGHHNGAALYISRSSSSSHSFCVPYILLLIRTVHRVPLPTILFFIKSGQEGLHYLASKYIHNKTLSQSKDISFK